jgi:putative transposase
MMPFDDLTDREWALIEGLFRNEMMPRDRAGRPRVQARAVVNAVLWAFSTGHGWSRLPGRYPSRPTCIRRVNEWQADGTLAEIVKRLDAGGRKVFVRGPVGDALNNPQTKSNRTRIQTPSWTAPQTWLAPLGVMPPL